MFTCRWCGEFCWGRIHAECLKKLDAAWREADRKMQWHGLGHCVDTFSHHRLKDDFDQCIGLLNQVLPFLSRGRKSRPLAGRIALLLGVPLEGAHDQLLCDNDEHQACFDAQLKAASRKGLVG